jgi:hypothetical protein
MMASAPQPAFDGRRVWENFHQSYSRSIEGIFNLFPPNPGAPTKIADLNITSAQFQALIGTARRKGFEARAVGSRWSLSEAPTTSGYVLNTNRLRGRMKIGPGTVHPSYPGTSDQRSGLFLLQCGNTVADVNELLESNRRALHTSGAANGQTIAGATSTGTHGSALDFGALHDHIVAIHLIATETKPYWLERATRPVVKDSFPASLGAEIRRDDDLFNAAMLSFGSFGVIHNVVIESRPIYILDTQPGVVQLDEALWKAIGALDFSAHPFFAAKGRPYFFQAVINPNSSEVLINANYETECVAGYQPDYALRQKPGAVGPGFDTLSLVGSILDKFPKLIPPIATVAAKALIDLNPRDGTPGEVYGYKAPQLHVASGSIAVPLERGRETLEALIKLNQDLGKVPLVLGCRYVRPSPALLAFNRFPVTMAISIDGIDSKRSRQFFTAAADKVESLKIPFTQHWGKVNAYTPKRVRNAYGANVDKWIAARHLLLPDPADRAIFANDYIRDRGLAG